MEINDIYQYVILFKNINCIKNNDNINLLDSIIGIIRNDNDMIDFQNNKYHILNNENYFFKHQ